DVAFQGRETCNPFYLACPAVVQDAMNRLGSLTGRHYRLFDYVGAPDAERVLVLMGSGAGAAEETVEALNAAGEQVGLVKAGLDNAKSDRPRNHFTVGIIDDVTHTSLDYDPHYSLEPDDVVRAVFYGLGSDGTVGANKNSIKIIGEQTEQQVQGYFVYDS